MRVVCNRAANELLKFVATKKTNEIIELRDRIAQWYREDRDLSELIPLNFKIPESIKDRLLGGGLVSRITKSVLEEFPQRMNGVCPAYDLILQMVHDMAATRQITSKEQETAEAMRQIQVIAAFLGNERVKPWYYKNLDRAYQRVASQLVDEHGEPGPDSAGGGDGEKG
ncbi:MAG: hypothetical protein K6U74_02185 [Firmicutes bacterium]|nr:hypothetical protein [Bacillota bacterium]